MKLTGLLVFLMLWAHPAHADIVIGVFGPLTGPVASESDYWKVGFEQAVEDINAQGGVLGQKIKVELMDDACDPRQAVAVMNRMVSSGVKVILNASCSGATLAAAPVADEAGIPQLVTIALNSAITDHGWPSVFRLSGRDEQHARLAADTLLKRAQGKKIAIIHDKSAFCKGLADLVQKDLADAGERNLEVMAINPGENDFTNLIARLKHDGVEAVYLSLFMREGGLFARQAQDQKMSALMVGASTLSLQEFRHIAGPAAEAVYVVLPKIEQKIAPDLLERIKQKSNVQPNIYTYGSYAGIQVLAQAITQAGTANSASITRVLRQGRFTTVMGDLNFNAKGDSDVAVRLYQWRGDEIVMVP